VKRLLSLLISLLLFGSLFAQKNKLEDSLKQNLANAKTPAEQVQWNGELSRYYTAINPTESDRYQKKMLETAEFSRDRKLLIKAMLTASTTYFDYGGKQENVKKGIEFAENALQIARSSSLEEYIGWAYINLSRGARANGESDKGLNYSNLALSRATSSKNDSLKIVAYNSVGSSYLYKKEKLLAYRNYLTALDIAEQTGSYTLILACYQRMIDFNRSLEDWEKAKDYQFKADSLARSYKQYYDVLEGYGTMAGLYASAKQYDFAMMYYERAIAYADSIKFPVFKINGYMGIVNLYLTSNRYSEALSYFESKPELRNFMRNSGMSYLLDQGYGSLYTFVGKYDSASYYFKRAEPAFENYGTKGTRFFFYVNYAFYFKKIKDYANAIRYWEKADTLAKQVNHFDMILMAASNLDSLHMLTGDYKAAYGYRSVYSRYKDSVDKMAAEKDLLIMEVNNEKQRAEKQVLIQEEATRKRHNIQYMGITAAIASIFILLVMAGAFKVSPRTIKIIGFFAFIFLFEFIILLADNQIHHFTHGEPWMVLAIKIVLIAMLLPLHHWLEEKAVHYLTSRSVLKINSAKLFRRGGSKTNPAVVENLKGIN